MGRDRAHLMGVVAVLWALVAAGCNGISGPGGGGQAPGAGKLASPSDEDLALDRIATSLDAADAVHDRGQHSGPQQQALREAIDAARDAVADYRSKRSQGSTRDKVMGGIGVGATAIVADNATGIGVADDFVLIGLGIAAIGTHILTNSPASRGELERAWRDIGERMDALAATLEGIIASQPAPIASQPARRDTPVDLSMRKPANQNQPRGTTDVAPQPAPDQPDDKDHRCKPIAVCPHAGGDAIHDSCADEVPPNQFRGCDVRVNGKLFDALAGNVLWEVKTNNWSEYTEWLKQAIRGPLVTEVQAERGLAIACGYEFVFAVADQEMYRELQEVGPFVRHVPQCQRRTTP